MGDSLPLHLSLQQTINVNQAFTMKPNLRPIERTEVDLESCLRKVRGSAAFRTKIVLRKLLRASTTAPEYSHEIFRNIVEELLEPDIVENVSC